MTRPVRASHLVAAAAALALGVGLAVPAGAVPAAAPPASAPAPAAVHAVNPPRPGWVRWEGRYFVCWRPSNSWQVIENANGIDVSSPTGDVIVSLGFSGGLSGPVTPSQVLGYLFQMAQQGSDRLLSYSVTGRTSVSSIPGGQRQSFSWVGVRLHPLKGRVSVRGITTIETYANASIGSYGFAAYSRMAPRAQWTKYAATMATIQKYITYMGG